MTGNAWNRVLETCPSSGAASLGVGQRDLKTKENQHLENTPPWALCLDVYVFYLLGFQSKHREVVHIPIFQIGKLRLSSIK